MESAQQTKPPAKRPAPRSAWKPGQSGNPKGASPKPLTLTNALREFVAGRSGRKKRLTVLLEKLWTLVEAGDLAAIKYVFDRVDGMPTQRHEVSMDEVRESARRIARELGLDEDEAVREAEAIVRGER
jgi:hypothetical protein